MKQILLIVSVIAIALASPAHAADWRMCRPGEKNGPQKRCLVDGDTIWISGYDQCLRLKSFDTPEPTTNICGGQAEVDLAHRANARMLQLLNDHQWTVEIFDTDRTGRRLEATIRIDGVDVGDIVIAEGLARRWPDGHEFWCSRWQLRNSRCLFREDATPPAREASYSLRMAGTCARPEADFHQKLAVAKKSDLPIASTSACSPRPFPSKG